MKKIDLDFLKEFHKNHCLIIGEVAQAHDGSLGTAHAYIDAIANAGADAVKFQTHIANAESTLNEPWRVKFSKQDLTRYDYWKRMEFSSDQWVGLKQHANECGLIFLSSPFSVEAFDLLSNIGVPVWKIASGEISNEPLLTRILSSKLPVLLSTGMSSIPEIDKSVNQIKKSGNPFAVLQCTSMYPTPPEKIGLNMLPFFHERYKCPVGLSDHSGKIFPGLAAITLGAVVLEVHVTLSRESFGPDVVASVTTSELTQQIEGIRFIENMLDNPIDKGLVSEDLNPIRNLFSKSIVAKYNLPIGTILSEDMLAFKKPGDGLSPESIPQLVGKRLTKNVLKNSQIKEGDFE